MKFISIHLTDGCVFTAPEHSFSTIVYPAHEHKDTKLLIPQICKVNCPIGQINITEITQKEVVSFLSGGEEYGLLNITAIEETPEHILCGYATREELDKKKEEILAEKLNKDQARIVALEGIRKERKEKKKAKKVLKAKAKKAKK